MRAPPQIVPLLLLVACTPKPEDPGRTPTDSENSSEVTDSGDIQGNDLQPKIDGDQDGYTIEQDCNDGDAAVNPGATEACNGLDDNCDGETDEGLLDDAVLIMIDGADIFSIDASGAVATIASLSSTSLDINSLATDINSGQTYAHNGAAHVLYELDVCTGGLTKFGKTGVGSCCGLSFGPDGLLYGLDKENDQLVVFDSSWNAAAIGALGFDLDHCGLAYDCSADRLIGMHVDSTADTGFLFTVDVSTGEATKWIDLDPTVNWKGAGLEVEPGGGVVYATAASNTYRIDTATGAATLFSTVGGNNLSFWWGSCN